MREREEEEVFTAFFRMAPPLCHAMSTVPDCDDEREQVRVMLSPGAAVRVEDVRVTVGTAGREHNKSSMTGLYKCGTCTCMYTYTDIMEAGVPCTSAYLKGNNCLNQMLM